MLTPHVKDKNRTAELERKKKEPWTFGQNVSKDVKKEGDKNANSK